MLANHRRRRRREDVAETTGLLAIAGGAITISMMLTSDAVPWITGSIVAVACVTIGFVAFHLSDAINSQTRTREVSRPDGKGDR